jgi:hypothetical protein
VPQGSIFDPLLFLIYNNDLPEAVKHRALPTLFADHTSVLHTSPNNIQMQNDLNKVFAQLNTWFKSNLHFFFLNLEKTYFLQFTNKGKYSPDIQITCEGKPVSLANETKFLGLYINNNLSWKAHTEYIRAKLSSACYAVMSLKPYVITSTL